MSLQEEGIPEKVIIDQDWIEEPEGALSWFSVIGKLLSKKRPNLEAIKMVLSKAWRVESGFQVKEVCPFWLRIYGLPINMMNEKIGIAVGEAVGPVLEFDEDWGRYLRIRIQMNLSQSLKAGTIVYAPSDELYVDFRYEKLLDYCWICGLLDHIDNDCLVAVSLRKNHLSVKKKYTCSLKAEFPPPIPGKEAGSSQRRGGSGTSLSPVLRGSRDVNLPGASGSRSVPSKSIPGGGVPERNHVDNLALYSNRTARALQFDEPSCEIISRMNGNPVRHPPILKGSYGNNGQRGGWENSFSVEPVRMGILRNLGAHLQEQLIVEGGGENRGVEENDVESSNNPDEFILLNTNLGRRSATGLNFMGAKSIPGVGLVSTDPGDIAGGSRGMGMQNNFQRDFVSKAASTGPDYRTKSVAAEEIYESYDPDSPFVFGAGVSGARKIRKWKKTARSIPSGSADLLCHETLGSVGQKRATCYTGVYLYSMGGKVKRFREAVMEVPDAEESRDDDLTRAIIGMLIRMLMLGRSGGLALLWMASDCISLLSYSFYHIDVAIGSDIASRWRFTGFYEKDGGNLRPASQMNLFNEVILDCNFRELPVQGPLMTWSRKQNGELVFERLDRSMATPDWWERFGFSVERHLITSKSDHLPLLVFISDRSVLTRHRRRTFKYEQMWGTHESFDSVIKQAWPNGDMGIVDKISTCSKELDNWNKTHFGNLQHNIKLKKNEFDKLYSLGRRGNQNEFSKCKLELEDLLHQEELLWRQRSKIHWLKDGDKNTEFFHAVASSRKNKKAIDSIEDSSGAVCEDPIGIANIFTEYFKEIFTSSNPSHTDIQAVLNHLEGRIDDDMRLHLEAEYTAKEVKQAVFQMSGSKALGPDGMSLAFFQRCWQGEIFYPTRGIRQGDPLSPYLFLLCMEGLSSLISAASRSGSIHGISISRSVPRVSHLFFSDDNILFLQASKTECDAVISLLNLFEKASGQKINIDKSSILFSANTPASLQSEIMSYLGIQKVLDRDKYLGLPIMVGRSKTREFQFLKDRLKKRITSWNSRLFSRAGKAVMIQSVAQAIPVYLMSVFQFPKSFVQELNSLIAGYWWGDTMAKKKIHWKNWEAMCSSKLEGGLGFRDFEAFNLSLLAKQGRKVIIVGSRFRVGEGNLDIWKDRWVANPPSFRPTPRDENIKPELKVRDLIDVDNRMWRIETVLDLFEEEDAYRILALLIPRHPTRDLLIWNGTCLGEFLVKSAYYVAREVLQRSNLLQGPAHQTWKLVWSSQVLPKIHFFGWRFIWNILPTKCNLLSRGLNVPQNCEVCGDQVESVFHVFFYCKFSELVWDQIGPWVQPSLDQWDSDRNFWDFFIEKAASIGQIDRVLVTLWLIWNNRNKALYELVSLSPSALHFSVSYILEQLRSNNRRRYQISFLPNQQLNWIPPPFGVFKINTNAAFCSGTGEAGLGVVIRDSEERIILTVSRCLNFIADSLHAGIHAILFRFELAIEHGIDLGIFESDSLLAVNLINKTGPVFWEGGLLIDEIRDLATLFNACNLQFVHREANTLAHDLANLRQDVVWCGIIPPGVL
ncbi:reverse transcriptase [Corchorus capsularis]|uniref:Reverse transcriptase n=1 Tax=Corchorus capsularis TaxID=210143 RepID=A0A1R3FZL6_COCAP|nr:reverse transcriptase [Corchorus capsularis]